MKTITAKDWSDIPEDYTGIVEWEDGYKEWYKNGSLHREDGPAYISKTGYKQWYLDGICVCNLNYKVDFLNLIILSKPQHPEYPTVQIWKILGKNGLYEQTIIPGMEELIIE